jgi:hypothetical protein
MAAEVTMLWKEAKVKEGGGTRMSCNYIMPAVQRIHVSLSTLRLLLRDTDTILSFSLSSFHLLYDLPHQTRKRQRQ